MAFLFMCVYSFSFCVTFCLSLIFNRKCLLAKIQENIINFCHLGLRWILSLKGDGLLGTTDEFATISFYLILFSAALVELTNSIPVHSLILSSHLLICLPLQIPFIVPCRIVFAKPNLEMWPNPLSFSFLTRVRSLSYSPITAWIFLQNLIGNMVLVWYVK